MVRTVLFFSPVLGSLPQIPVEAGDEGLTTKPRLCSADQILDNRLCFMSKGTDFKTAAVHKHAI